VFLLTVSTNQGKGQTESPTILSPFLSLSTFLCPASSPEFQENKNQKQAAVTTPQQKILYRRPKKNPTAKSKKPWHLLYGKYI
jgi:hypothetical protein